MTAPSARAAITYVNTVNGLAAGNAASYTINAVAATAGNLLVARIATSNNTTAPTGPTGWTRQTFTTSVTGAVVLTTWTFSVTTTGTYSYVWNSTGPNGGWAGSVMQYSGVDAWCPVGATGGSNGTTVLTGQGKTSRFPLPVITTVATGAILNAGYAHVVKNKVFTPPGGYTARGASKGNTNNTPSTGSADKPQPAPGSSGAATALAKNSDVTAFVADLIELAPAETTGVTLSTAAMSFGSVQGSSPAAQTFTIRNSHLRAGCPAQTYTASVGSFSSGWSAANLGAPNVAAVNLAVGATSAAISVTVNATALPSGTYTAVITITDAAGNFATIDITLSVACVVARSAGVAVNTATAATALTLTVSGGWSNGDQLVAALLADTTTAPAAPAGWTLVGSNTAGGALGMWVYRAAKSGAASPTWTGFTSGKLAGVMAAYSNANSIALLDAPPVPFTPAVTTSGAGAVDANAATTVGANASVIAAYGINSTAAGTALTPGAGLTSISTTATGAAAGDLTLTVGSDLLIPAAGTALSKPGTVAPAQVAPKLGALCTLGAANTPPAVSVIRSPAIPSQGDFVTYTIDVTNPAGNQPISTLVMSDTLPANLTFASLAVDAAGAGLVLSSNPGTGNVQGASGTLVTPLAAGATVTFTLVGSLACGVTGPQSSTVTAETPGTCGNPVRVLNAFLPGVVAAPIIAMTRTPTFPVQGDYVTYSIIVTNNNAQSPLNALTMSDTLPAGLTFVALAADPAGAGLTLSNNPGAGSVQGASGQLTAPLSVGNSVTFSLVAKIGCATTGAQLNRAYAETSQACQKAASGTDSFTPAAMVADPVVSLSRNPATPARGDTVTYMLVVQNPAGNSPINALVVSDTLPPGFDVTLFEGGSDGAGDGLTLSDDLGTGTVQGAFGLLNDPLAPGASFTFTVTGTISCAATGLQSHQAYGELGGGCFKALSVANTLTLSGAALAVSSVVPVCGPVAGGFTMTITGTFGTGTCIPTGVTIGLDVATVLGTPTATKILVSVPVFTGTTAGSGQDVVVSASAGTGTLAGGYTPFTSPGALAVAGSVRPVSSAGQWFAVGLTVTNTGGAPVTGVLPSIAIAPGAALTAVISSPTGGLTLAPGAATTFEWTYSASGAGVVTWTMTAAASACTGAGLLVAASVSATLQTQAALAAAVGILPAPVCNGDLFLVTVTVTNTGGATAAGVAPGPLLLSGAGNAAYVSGPSPAAPASLIGGGSITFSYTLTASAPGLISFSSTVSGSDANSGATVTTGPLTSAVTAIQTPGVLTASLALPASAGAGQWFSVSLTVTNTGGATVTGVTATAFAGAGLATLRNGPVPAGPVALAGGTSQTFVWTFSANGTAGVEAFTASATGATCAVTSLTAGLTATMTVGSSAQLDVTAAVFGGPLCVGETTLVTVTVTNTGGTAANGVIPSLPTAFGTGTASYSDGPNPAAPVSLSPGTAITFSFTFTASSSGLIFFSSSASGSDALTASMLAAGPAQTATITVTTPGALVAAASVRPLATVGQGFTVTLTVTNTGGTVVSGLAPALATGPGGAVLVAESSPAGGGSLAPGAASSFLWTFSSTGAGAAGFTLTMTGATCAAGTATATAFASLVIQAPAAIAISGPHASPDPLCQGALITVSLAVTNTGQADATGVAGSIAFAGSGSALAVSAPGPLTLAGGSSTILVWTFDADNAGGLWFTITVAGADGNSAGALTPAASTSNTITITSAGFLAGAAAAPATVSVGQTFTVTLTVTNEGGANVTGIIPSIGVAPAGAPVSALGAAPSSVPVLGSGASATFVWTYSASGTGPVSFTLTAAGFACAGSPMVVAATVPVLSQAPAALMAALMAFPTLRTVGQTFLATLTVTNTGGADALIVTPVELLPFGGGGGTVSAGPNPSSFGSLSAGTSVTFTWTVTASSSGTLYLSSTVTGADANTGLPLGTGTVSSNAVLIQSPAALVASLQVWSSTVCLGTDLTVTVTVTNTGEATADGVAMAVLRQAGAGALTDAGTPGPVSTLAGGDSLTFTWTLTGATAGPVSFSTTATATDANAGTAIASLAAGGPALVVDAGVLAASVSTPAVVSTGQWFAIALTVTNTGSAAVTGVTPDLAAGPLLDLRVAVSPAGPQTLNAGSAVTFVWTYSASGAGAVSFTGTAAGTSLCGPLAGSGNGALTVVSRAALVASLTAGPTPRDTNQAFVVTLTVTNAGQADATGFAVAAPFAAGSGSVGTVAGPWPVTPATLPGGASMNFTWTYTGATPGFLGFTTTITAADANSAAGIVVGPVASGTVLVQSPAALAVSGPHASPDPLCQGALITVSLAVTNTGQADATGIAAALATAGAGSVALVSAPGPLTLAGGSATTLVWTFDANAAGGVWFTVTVTGADGNTAAVLAPAPGTSNTITITSAGFLAGAGAGPVAVSVGQTFTVTLTVTNAGGANVTGILPTIAVAPGSAPVSAVGAAPSPVPVLGSGASATFAWTYSASGAGPVSFTLTAAGFACAGSPMVVAAIVPVVLQSPAALSAALSSFPTPRTVGQTFLATLTVTNSGQAGAANVTPAGLLPFGAGGGAVSAGPNPSSFGLLSAGTSVTFTWTVTASSSGTLYLSSTATGLDANSGLSMSAGPAISNAILIQTPAALAAAMHVWSGTVCLGSNVRVTLTVTNTGQATANGVAAAVLRQSGAGALADAGTPGPVAALAGGASRTFTWTLTGSTAGLVSFSTTVTATDANDGAPVSVQSASAGSALVVDSGVLTAAVAAPATVSTGQWFTVSLTVTNTGSAAVTGVTPDLAAGPLLDLRVAVSPAGPQTLNAGSAVTFVWTYSASGAGAVSFTATAAGASLCGAISGAAPGSLTVLARAALASSLVVFPTPRVPGLPVTVTLTVTNTGQAAADLSTLEIPAVSGSGGALLDAGPTPTVPLSLAGGAAATFTWTFSATAQGSVTFSVTVGGTDGTSGAPFASLVVSPAPLVVSSVATLIARVAVTATPLTAGQPLTVSITVTNTGGVAATGVTATLFGASTAGLTPTGFPAGGVTIAAGASATFSFTFATTTAGGIAFTLTVSGADSVSGDPLLLAVSFAAAGAVVTPPPAVVAPPPTFTPGTTAAGAEIYPLPFRPATGPLRFTKLPADSRVRIYTVAGELVRELDADSRGVVEWNGTNAGGSDAASAVYFYVIQPPTGPKHVGKLEVAR